MTNKIGSGGIDNRPVQVGAERAVKRTPDSTESAATATAKETSGTGGGVRITDSARQLAALEQAIRSMPDVDEARVAKIRSAITAGTYQVSPERIADKLMRMENELH